MVELMNFHFLTDNEDSPVHAKVRNATHDLGEDNPEFTEKELEVVFNSLNKGKAPGTNGLPLEII